MTTREIRLPDGHIALIDEQDWELVAPYPWRAHSNRRLPAGLYVCALVPQLRFGYTHIRLHRLITRAVAGVVVDHVNRDGLDNRRQNLRLSTNAHSRLGCDNTSGYKGVSWHKGTRKWQARASVGGVNRHLGLFKDPWDAAQAYNEAALATWGEFAYLNERLPERVSA
jgi:hypothetical protein